ncbi:retinol dehydrogenase 12 [Anopheles nili]|uniref:retinol dehydrogenase 12 n=1 Tax=Anopheles nili TaxID=185578 RepID=UPI00237A632D|nr:retinol dehydrogenase 12 [Anopheles nili]
MDEIKTALAEADPFASWWPFILAGIVFVVGTIRTYMGGQPCPNGNSIPNRVIVVTGASGGIGREVCRELARRKARHLVLACRDPATQGEPLRELLHREAPECTSEVLPLDLRSFDSVRRFARQVQAHHPAVDVLVNCAGVIFHPSGRTVDGFEQHLQCNYLAHFLLTQLLRPQLERSEFGGRIVNVSAHGYTAAKVADQTDPLNLRQPSASGRDAFSHSKLAIVLASRALAKRLAAQGNVNVNCCSPGLVRGTGHLRHSPIMKALFAKVLTFPWMWMFMKNPTQGAHTIVRLVTDPELASSNGEFYNDCERVEVSELAKDDELAERLYRASLQAVGLPDDLEENVRRKKE